MRFVFYIFLCCFIANTLTVSVLNLSIDQDDLTEISLDDSEDDTEEEEEEEEEEENVDPKDLFSHQMIPNIFTQFDFDNKKSLMILSKKLYYSTYFKNLSPPPEVIG